MLLFRSEEHIQFWCKRNKVQQGAILSLQQVWELSELWYHDRLSVDYHGRTAAQAEEIFRQVGLISEFWQAPRPDEQTSRQED